MNPNGYGIKGGSYVAYRATTPIIPDGRAASPAWALAPRSPRFVEMLTGAPAPLATTASILWDDRALYVAMWADEPNLIATMTERDALLFYENDMELFIDGGNAYYELEFNALGTIYEVFFIWRDAYTRGGYWDQPRFDVHSPEVHSFGGDYVRGPSTFWTGSHPRGTRWAFLNYDLPGLEVHVHADGKLNDPSVIDKGWSAEIVIPWASLVDLANGRSLPPKDGDVWGILLARFQHLQTRAPDTSAMAGWAAHQFGVADTHVPESFTQVTFRAAAAPR